MQQLPCVRCAGLQAPLPVGTGGQCPRPLQHPLRSHLLRNRALLSPERWPPTPADVPDLPHAAVSLLGQRFAPLSSRLVHAQTSASGDTVKLLVQLQDGLQVESVIMRYDTTLSEYRLSGGGPYKGAWAGVGGGGQAGAGGGECISQTR